MEENRFVTPNDTVEDYVESLQNKNTKGKTERDVRLLKRYLTSQNEEREVNEIEPQELDRYLAEFIRSVRRKDVNKLNTLMKTMATKGNLSNERLTNHSARKGMIQKLNDNDIPPTHIMQLSGHKNIFV